MTEPDGHYRDRNRKPISLFEWSDLYKRDDYRTVARDSVDGETAFLIVTIWQGFYPYGFDSDDENDRSPIFSSAIARRYGDETVWGWEEWYCTEDEARGAHARRLAALREGRTP